MGNELSCCNLNKKNSTGSQTGQSEGRSGSADGSSGLRRRHNPRASLNEILRKPSVFKSFDSDSNIYNGEEAVASQKLRQKKKTSNSGLDSIGSVDSMLSQRKASTQKDIKILLLGTGESGKSTILKQMKILHSGGFSMEERMNYRLDIYRNITEGIQQIIKAIRELDVNFYDESVQEKTEIYSQYLINLPLPEYEEWECIPQAIKEAIKFLWIDSGIQKIYSKLSHATFIIDSVPYFFDELERISAPNYVPTDADIVRARNTTTGISEVTFKSRFFNIKMVDVGGQRSERDKKWVQCFENVTCVIFCVSLSEFDQTLLEDNLTNRMLESFQLFEDVVNSQWFLNSSIVLFLNKTDLFCKKIATIPLSDYFEDFSGDNKSFEEAAEFLRDKFLSLNQYRLQIYPYLTCATDTENISMVFQAVEETVLANALRDTGIF